MKAWAQPFLKSALDGGELSASRPARFNPGKTAPRCRLDRRLGGPQSRYGHCGVEKNLLPLPEIEPPPSRPSAYKLRYPGSRFHIIFDSNYDIKRKIRKWKPWFTSIFNTQNYGTEIFRVHILLLFISTVNGFLPSSSGTTIRHRT
jgi:hypothetical protein